MEEKKQSDAAVSGIDANYHAPEVQILKIRTTSVLADSTGGQNPLDD